MRASNAGTAEGKSSLGRGRFWVPPTHPASRSLSPAGPLSASAGHSWHPLFPEKPPLYLLAKPQCLPVAKFSDSLEMQSAQDTQMPGVSKCPRFPTRATNDLEEIVLQKGPDKMQSFVLFCVRARGVFFLVFFLARSTLRFRTYVTAHRWTWPSLGFFKCLNFPQNSHHPFHSCGYCSGCGGIKRGSSDRDCLGPGALGGIPESRASGRFSPGLPAAACVGEFREQRELLTQIIKARCFSSGARVGRVSPTGPAVFTE